MNHWHTLSLEDQNEVVSNAQIWRNLYRDHVNRLIQNSGHTYGIPPTGSDLWQPRLWKEVHWVWFDRGGE